MSELYKTIIFLGKPGCGKGTQAKKIHDLGIGFHFSTGNMFRNIDETTDVGRYVKDLIDRGKYVDSETTVILMQRTLNKYVQDGRYNPNRQYLLLDGFPRTEDQVEMTNGYFNIVKVLHLYVPEEVAIQRLRERGKTSEREDDQNEATLQERMETYKQETEHLLSKYPNKYDVDTSPPVEEVHQKILEILGYAL
ncbi:MAG: nucleoside monophosphate kinase [archaeon]|nr:nucleoside monophosphate kinase [archaeon]